MASHCNERHRESWHNVQSWQTIDAPSMLILVDVGNACLSQIERQVNEEYVTQRIQVLLL